MRDFLAKVLRRSNVAQGADDPQSRATPESNRPLIFLSYAKEDRPRVEQLYRDLRNAGLHPWMDQPPFPFQKYGIPPGADWDSFLREKIRSVDLAFLCLSNNAIDKQGYVQREFRLVLDRANEFPPGRVFAIPILLEECSPKDIRIDSVTLNSRQWYRLYRDGIKGLVELVNSLAYPKESLLAVPQPSSEESKPLLAEEENFFALCDQTDRYKAEWLRVMEELKQISELVSKGVEILSKHRGRLNNLRDPLVKLAFQKAAPYFEAFASELSEKTVALHQLSKAMSDSFMRSLVVASDWELAHPEIFNAKLKDILGNRTRLLAIRPEMGELHNGIMKSLRGTTEFNRARRLAAESLRQFEEEVEHEIRNTEDQETTIKRILAYL